MSGHRRRSEWFVGMRRPGLLVLPAALMLGVVTGCGDDDGDASGVDGSQSVPDTADLDGRTFVSAAVTGYELVAGSELRLTFEGTNMAAVAGCNTQSGAYEIADDGTLKWSGSPVSTMMGCDEELAAQDVWIAEILAEGLGASLDGDDLTLSGNALTIELTGEVDAELVGTSWTLDAIVANESASSLPAGIEAPTIEFRDDGTVAVFSGCNRGSGNYDLGDGTITFGPLAITRMACEGDATAVEASVLTVLDGTVEFAIENGALTVTQGDAGLRYRVG